MRRFFAQVTVAFALAAAPAGAAAALDEPTRVITVAPAAGSRAGAPEPRALLADRLGTAPATSSVAAPRGRAAEAAARLAPLDGATREYAGVRVSVYRMGDESVAYALLQILQPAGAAPLAIGDDAWSDGAGALAFRLGTYTAVIEGGAAASREAAAAALAERIGPQPVRAGLLRALPVETRIAGSERYAPSLEGLRRLRPDLSEDLFRLSVGGADAVVADYAQAGASPLRLVVVDYQTPQLAADAERSVAAFYAQLPPEAREQRVVKREGNYMVEATGVADRAAAEAVVRSVRYEVTIKMLKGDDPVSLLAYTEEARKAAMLFINSFAIVGIGFLGAIATGLVVGTVLFRKRRAAAAGRFSDAGGMTHLELGPHRLRPAEPGGLLPGMRGD
jgi:hypothetical protein